MKLFISWSGEPSRKFAEALREFLSVTLICLETYYSPEDIKSGAAWSKALLTALKDHNMGLICLTKANFNARWINFEAGAMIGKFGDSRVFPILLDFADSAELPNPVGLFNASMFSEEKVHKLVFDINELLDSSVKKETLEKLFNKFWPELKDTVDSIVTECKSTEDDSEENSTNRTERRLLGETLDTVRYLARMAEKQEHRDNNSTLSAFSDGYWKGLAAGRESTRTGPEQGDLFAGCDEHDLPTASLIPNKSSAVAAAAMLNKSSTAVHSRMNNHLYNGDTVIEKPDKNSPPHDPDSNPRKPE